MKLTIPRIGGPLLLDTTSAGFRDGLKRFVWSTFRTIAAGAATVGLEQLRNVDLSQLTDPSHIAVASTFFVAVRSLLSFIANWAQASNYRVVPKEEDIPVT